MHTCTCLFCEKIKEITNRQVEKKNQYLSSALSANSTPLCGGTETVAKQDCQSDTYRVVVAMATL